MIPPPPRSAIGNGRILFQKIKGRAWIEKDKHVLSEEVVG